MSIVGRLSRWRRQRRRKRAAARTATSPLREFVYMDEVSVYSLTASRLGSIATEFTDTETSSLAGEIESSIEGFGGFAKGGLRAKSSASRAQSSQVLRKSIIQTAFKDLVELEAERLALGRTSPTAPPTREPAEDLAAFVRNDDGALAIDPLTLARGRMIELEVELEAEAVFRVNAVVSAFLEIVQEDLEVFGLDSPIGITEARAMSRVLDKLLTGLVPLRGRAVDYLVAEVDGHEWILHRSVVEQLPVDTRSAVSPLVIVGVAEQKLFWKDIRRVLFSNSQFRVFCRIAQPGLRDHWTPVKLTDVLKEIAPEFEGQLLGALGESTLTAMGDAVAHSSTAAVRNREQLDRAANAFVRSLADHHGGDLSEESVRQLVATAVSRGGRLDTVDDRRVFFGELVQSVDDCLKVSTSPEVAQTCRVAAANEAGVGFGGVLFPTPAAAAPPPPVERERFLDTEIVAIYW